MKTPMAVLGMVPVEGTKEEKTDPTTWAWKPEVKDFDRLADAVQASNNTSKNTFRDTVDHGEGK